MLSHATRTIGAIAVLLGVAACSVFGGAAAPEPEYDVVLSEPPFELRDYGELVVAKTPMTGGASTAFGRLFDFPPNGSKPPASSRSASANLM